MSQDKRASARGLNETEMQTFEVFLNEKSRKGLDNVLKENKEKMISQL